MILRKINTGTAWRLSLLLLPLAGITLWFLYDGGISFGWDFIWYWTWIIAFLLAYEAVLLLNVALNFKKAGFSRENRIFLLSGLVLLAIATIFFTVAL